MFTLLERTVSQAYLEQRMEEYQDLPLIGEGMSSKVYACGSQAIKVFSLIDIGYTSFIRCLADVEENRYLPRIHQAELLHSLGGGMGIVCMERLEAVRRCGSSRRIGEVLSQAIETKNFSHYRKERKAALELIARAQESAYTSVYDDLHAGNLMRRGHQVVIIDPLV